MGIYANEGLGAGNELFELLVKNGLDIERDPEVALGHCIIGIVWLGGCSKEEWMSCGAKIRPLLDGDVGLIVIADSFNSVEAVETLGAYPLTQERWTSYFSEQFTLELRDAQNAVRGQPQFVELMRTHIKRRSNTNLATISSTKPDPTAKLVKKFKLRKPRKTNSKEGK